MPEKPFENPTDRIGTVIYPREATPAVRHLIDDNFVITGAGTLLFLADRFSTGNLCFVRVPLLSLDPQRTQENCVTSASFDAPSLSAVHVTRFSEDAPSDLILSVETGDANYSVQRDFRIDKESLSMTPVWAKETTAENGVLPIPWRIQRGAVIFFTPVLLKAAVRDVITVRLTVEANGNVGDATVSGAPADLSELVKRVVLSWKFKPTILNGHYVKVITQFTAPANALTKIPD